MNITDIMREWKPRALNERAGLDWWNNKAAHFGQLKLPTAETSVAMRLIQENGMINAGDRVLDVGCGGGRFSFALEKMGARTVGTDFSPKMIEECSRNRSELGMTGEFQICNWHTAELDEFGWRKSFDLVLANMTPAITSAETFMKLSEASKNWCLMVKPARRTNSVLDALNEMVGAEKDADALDSSLAYAFDLLWLNGCEPRLEYERQVWEDDKPVENAVQEYTSRIRYSHDLTPEMEKKIEDYLREIAVDNVVHETTHTLIAAMYWQVKP